MKKTALIVAGGSGKRFKTTTPKQFLKIKNKPVLMHTIEKFAHLDNIILVLPKAHINKWNDFCKINSFNINHELVEGGKSRFESVKNGLNYITDTDIILIHDGVRPFVSKKTINLLIKSVSDNIGVVPVIPITESIRYIEKDKSQAIIRENYFKVQTPQCFKFNDILEAYNQKFKKKFTDDASVFEALNKKIIPIEGEIENIKITYPIDLYIAEKLLAQIL